jgi:NAD dependent epimerase/dehydratase family enzyme
MAGVARAWEEAVVGARSDRLLILRTGVVLDRGTPAIQRLTSLAHWGLGGRIGNGRQWISWLHGDDFRAAVLWLFDQPRLDEIVHVTSPLPVRNQDFMTSLRRAVHRPPAPPTPAALVRLGARLLRSDPALALTGRRGMPARLVAAGFEFRYPDLDPALHDVVRRR